MNASGNEILDIAPTRSWTLVFAAIFVLSINVFAQRRMPKIKIPFLANDIAVTSLNSPAWDRAALASIENYWSDKKAPTGRHFEARLLWSSEALYVRFDANQSEPLIISKTPNLASKTIGLWDRDVCEIFVAPDKADRNKYFEFEIAPTGEWVDLGIQWAPKKRKTDLEYSSRMESAVFVEAAKIVMIVMAIKIPWKAFGKTPEVGDIWLGNLFRCVGDGPSRGYLAWQATKTSRPNFHIPSKFGDFEFVD